MRGSVAWLRVVLTANIVTHAIALVAWACADLVPGWARYDGLPGTFNALSHGAFWLAYEVITLIVGALCLSVAKREAIVSRIWLWIVMLVIAILANMVHLVATIFERISCTSTLCSDRPGFIVGIFVLLTVVMCIEAINIYYATSYSNEINERNIPPRQKTLGATQRKEVRP